MRNRVLFVDDDHNLLDSIQRNFRRNYECKVASDANQALELMQKEPPFSIVVADLRMPGESGIGFLEKSRQLFPDTIRIMLTGYADMETALQAINKGGVFSFLQKPFDTRDLSDILQMATQEHQRIRKIQLDSLTDPLTGLYNRRFIEREFTRLMELSRRQINDFSIVFGDVNDFKSVNDNYGHSTGDHLLTEIASILVSTSRGTDLVCRFGGDEFLVIMEGAKDMHARRLIERLNEAVADLHLPEVPDGTFSLALGQASFPEDGDTLSALMEIADQRMYRQKSQK